MTRWKSIRTPPRRIWEFGSRCVLADHQRSATNKHPAAWCLGGTPQQDASPRPRRACARRHARRRCDGDDRTNRALFACPCGGTVHTTTNVVRLATGRIPGASGCCCGSSVLAQTAAAAAAAATTVATVATVATTATVISSTTTTKPWNPSSGNSLRGWCLPALAVRSVWRCTGSLLQRRQLWWLQQREPAELAL